MVTHDNVNGVTETNKKHIKPEMFTRPFCNLSSRTIWFMNQFRSSYWFIAILIDVDNKTYDERLLSNIVPFQAFMLFWKKRFHKTNDLMLDEQNTFSQLIISIVQ